jgi:hypothetical protein
MRRFTIGCLVLGGFPLGVLCGSTTGWAQWPPENHPTLERAQTVWRAFWNAVSAGEFQEAQRYVHSERPHLFPGPGNREELQQMASQMAHCRLDPSPLAVAPDEVIYRVLCEHRGETAEGQVGLRRDRDHAWRLSVL